MHQVLEGWVTCLPDEPASTPKPKTADTTKNVDGAQSSDDSSQSSDGTIKSNNVKTEPKSESNGRGDKATVAADDYKNTMSDFPLRILKGETPDLGKSSELRKQMIMFTGEQEGHGYVRLSIRDWHWDLMKSYLGFHSPTLEDIIATESGMMLSDDKVKLAQRTICLPDDIDPMVAELFWDYIHSFTCNLPSKSQTMKHGKFHGTGAAPTKFNDLDRQGKMLQIFQACRVGSILDVSRFVLAMKYKFVRMLDVTGLKKETMTIMDTYYRKGYWRNTVLRDFSQVFAYLAFKRQLFRGEKAKDFNNLKYNFLKLEEDFDLVMGEAMDDMAKHALKAENKKRKRSEEDDGQAKDGDEGDQEDEEESGDEDEEEDADG